MCTPQIPQQVTRQATQLPDGGAPVAAATTNSWQRAVLAGMATSAQGVTGQQNVGKSTLG